MRSKLFLLNPGFTDGGRGPYFCPDAEMSPVTGRMFISDSRHIVSYLSRHHKTVKPHG